MSLRVLIVAGLRVYAIYYATQVLTLIPLAVQMIYLEGRSARIVGDSISIGTFALGAVILWIFAERLAGAIVGKAEPTFDNFALTPQDAYTLAFVFLGLYFVLSSIGATAGQLYFTVAYASQLPENSPERLQALFAIYKPGITLMVGFAALAVRRWSRNFWLRLNFPCKRPIIHGVRIGPPLGIVANQRLAWPPLLRHALSLHCDMKTLTLLASVLVLTAGSASAQSAGPGVSYNSTSGTSGRASGSDVTGFAARTYPGMTPEQANRPPNPNVILKPKLGGAVTDTIKYGSVMISPTAPAELGIGEKYLSAPDTRYDLERESGPAAHRDTGGIKLFSVEF